MSDTGIKLDFQGDYIRIENNELVIIVNEYEMIEIKKEDNGKPVILVKSKPKEETPWLDKLANRISETSKKEEKKKIQIKHYLSNEFKVYFTTDNTSDVLPMSSEEVKDYLDEHREEIKKVEINSTI